ncbi:MAG: 50S ribosomal protein L9 [Verrucomicrobia bacterium]|jgi:large subunit ribosomal protein L9|nr:50S ribosomal protein L9 [Verrucomicrobiota bacterium]
MAKTDIILTHHIPGLGGESDHVVVAAGYARNYLFPNGLAIPLTGANKRRLESLKQRRAQREADELNSMNELGQSLSKLTLVISMKTGEDGRLFGSVTSGTICDELKHQFDATVEKRKIQLENPIKQLGEYQVDIKLHHDVSSTLKVRVESANPVEGSADGDAGDNARKGRKPAAAAVSRSK